MDELDIASSGSNVGQSVLPESSTPDAPAPARGTGTAVDTVANAGEAAVVVDNNTERQTSKRLTSIVWNYFKKENIGGRIKAVCSGCKAKFVGEGKFGTTHLKNHLKSCPYIVNKHDVRQLMLQTTISKEPTSTLTIGKFKFNHEVARRESVNMIILHEYPLSIVDHTGFRRYSASLNPDFKVVSRNTIKADVLKFFKEEKADLKMLLSQNEGRVAVTTDMWTASNQRKGYMAVTCHFIDNDWKLQNRLLKFIYVPCPHTKSTLASALVDSLHDYNLDEKVSTITVDNCSTNDGLIELLLEKFTPSSLILGGSILHMRCCAHILNLIVRDGLDIIAGSIELTRELVAYWTATPKRVEKFEDAVRYCKISETKKLVLDCKTRWNSTFEMLECALMYKDAFFRLRQREKKSQFVVPSEQEWELVREICKKLVLFARTTEAFSGRDYPTANLYFQKVCEIRIAIRRWQSCGIPTIESMANKMTGKFDKYWGVISSILAVASLLDPRKKMEHMLFYFTMIYGGDFGNSECEKVKKMLSDLVHEYEKRQTTINAKGSEVPFSSSETTNKRLASEVDDLEGLWEKHISKKPPKKHARSELDIYLDDDVLEVDNNKFNVLHWWNVESSKFPILSKIARDILAIPISTVASESAFSTGGRIIGPHRSRLHPKTVEALMCLQSWRLMQFKDASKGNSLSCGTVYEDEDVKIEGDKTEDEDDYEDD